jgi:hypothetical protein
MSERLDQTVTPIALTLSQAQIALLDQVAEEHLGTNNRSAAARYILTNWPKLKSAALRAASGPCSAQAGCDCPPDAADDDPLTPRAAAYRQLYTG